MKKALLALCTCACIAGCSTAPTPAPPNPDGNHELVTDPWERVGQGLRNK